MGLQEMYGKYTYGKFFIHPNGSYPIPSMYGIFTYIWHRFMVNVGKYAIHGSYGFLWWEWFRSQGARMQLYIWISLLCWQRPHTVPRILGFKPPSSPKLVEGGFPVIGNVVRVVSWCLGRRIWENKGTHWKFIYA